MSLPPQSFDVWHDRAVFHFLTALTQREAYVRSLLNAVRSGSHVIVSTFGPEGPTKCSGLDVIRYDAEALHQEFGKRFRIEGEGLPGVLRNPPQAREVTACARSGNSQPHRKRPVRAFDLHKPLPSAVHQSLFEVQLR